jgi:hypothetical protein
MLTVVTVRSPIPAGYPSARATQFVAVVLHELLKFLAQPPVEGRIFVEMDRAVFADCVFHLARLRLGTKSNGAKRAGTRSATANDGLSVLGAIPRNLLASTSWVLRSGSRSREGRGNVS